ncbi:hypothetical protein Tco_1236911 [Tanacetum coccineum]
MALILRPQLKFNSYKDAKTLMQAIKNRFGGNIATKKTQKNLLKQQYENFCCINAYKLIEQTYERLQKLISQLECMVKNKPEIETLSLDDLFNNLKAYESEVKGTSSSTTNSHNVAFLSSSSTNSTTRAVKFNAHDGCWNIAMLTIRARRFLKNTRRKLDMANKERIRFDKSKNREQQGTVPVRYLLSNILMSQCDGFVFDWSGPSRKKECVKDLKEQNKQLVKDLRTARISAVSYKTGLESVEARLFRKENGAPIIEDWVSDSDEENVPKVKTVEMFNKPSFAKIKRLLSYEQGKIPRRTSVDKNRPRFDSIDAINGPIKRFGLYIDCTRQIHGNPCDNHDLSRIISGKCCEANLLDSFGNAKIRKYHDSVAFATGCKRIKNSKRCNRKIRIPIAMWPCRVEEKMTLKDGTITRVPGKFQGYETSEEEPVEPT